MTFRSCRRLLEYDPRKGDRKCLHYTTCYCLGLTVRVRMVFC